MNIVFGQDRGYMMPSPDGSGTMVVDRIMTLRILSQYLSGGRFLIAFKPPSRFYAGVQADPLDNEKEIIEQREQEAFEAHQRAVKAAQDDDWQSTWKQERKWKHN